MAQRVKPLPAMRDTRVPSLGQEDPLEMEMAVHSGTFAQKIPWTEKPGSPWSCKESDMTEQLHFHFSFQDVIKICDLKCQNCRLIELTFQEMSNG